MSVTRGASDRIHSEGMIAAEHDWQSPLAQGAMTDRLTRACSTDDIPDMADIARQYDIVGTHRRDVAMILDLVSKRRQNPLQPREPHGPAPSRSPVCCAEVDRGAFQRNFRWFIYSTSSRSPQDNNNRRTKLQ